jgi:hypothetical protein
MVWHAETALPKGTELVVVPGGFSYGDYLRCGAIAARAPVMDAVRAFAADGGLVLGVRRPRPVRRAGRASRKSGVNIAGSGPLNLFTLTVRIRQPGIVRWRPAGYQEPVRNFAGIPPCPLRWSSCCSTFR